ncbi:PepSY-associated TM helix domain-containing protein [Pseudoduganella sp. UC29_106]|uniref:PepSY-associated TM helix domain-containing protein n=1 Tax=Pseudoduganella sp. UC29_106 TaxID=3374553 RepID=UPI00375767E1
MISGSLRSWLRDIHLYLALLFGVLFVSAGSTGVLLAWNHELDAALNPSLLQSRAVPANAAPVTPEKVEAALSRLSKLPGYGKPTNLMLPDDEHDVFVAWYRPAARQKTLFGTDLQRQVMLDQYTLEVLGERNYGEFGLSRPLLMPTLFHLHRYLLAGEGGKWVTGVTGCMLFLTSVMGLALWWPKANWTSFRKSLTVRGHLTSRQFNYSFHRAAGFFVTPMLAMLGFSGMVMNLPDVVRPVIGAVSTLEANEKLANGDADGRKLISASAAMAAAQSAVPEGRISRVTLGTVKAPFEIRMRQAAEVRKGDGNTRISVDAYSGSVLRVRNPLTAPSGDTFLNWMFPLHTGEAFHLPGRILISITGLTPLLFMITGLVLWLGRRAMHRRARQLAESAAPLPERVQKVG